MNIDFQIDINIYHQNYLTISSRQKHFTVSETDAAEAQKIFVQTWAKYQIGQGMASKPYRVVKMLTIVPIGYVLIMLLMLAQKRLQRLATVLINEELVS